MKATTNLFEVDHETRMITLRLEDGSEQSISFDVLTALVRNAKAMLELLEYWRDREEDLRACVYRFAPRAVAKPLQLEDGYMVAVTPSRWAIKVKLQDYERVVAEQRRVGRDAYGQLIALRRESQIPWSRAESPDRSEEDAARLEFFCRQAEEEQLQKTVALLDWWICRPENELAGQTVKLP